MSYHKRCIEILKSVIESNNKDIDDLKNKNKTVISKFELLKKDHEQVKNYNRDLILKFEKLKQKKNILMIENQRLNDLTYDGNGNWLYKRYCVKVEEKHKLEIRIQDLECKILNYELKQKHYNHLQDLLKGIEKQTNPDHIELFFENNI